MKKILLSFMAIAIALSSSAQTQWTTLGTNIYNANTGYVGIGTTTPVSALQVNGVTTVSALTVGYGITPAAISTDDNSKGLSFRIGGTEYMRLHNNGNVGIGTANPSARLSITPLSSLLTNMSTELLLGTELGLSNTTGAYLYPFEVQNNNTTNTNRLQFSPYRRVAGSAWMGTSYRMQFAVDNSFTDGSKAYFEIGASDPNTSGGGFIAFGTAGIDRLAITDNGNIGIGATDTKGYKLAVNGSAIATSMTVKLYGSWPDFVFNKTYHLSGLKYVSAYIDLNHHLPDMPSEREIKDKGINLGEIVKLQTKKIEELTLYAIDQQKRIEQLELEQQKNKEQDARIAALEAALKKSTGK